MLTEAEKEKIVAEETFRYETQARLVKDSKTQHGSKAEKLFEFLGKPFSLWLLSSVVVTSVGWGISKAQSEWEKQANRREQIHRLDTELSGRILNAQDEMEVLQARVSKGQYLQLNDAFILNWPKGCLDGTPPPSNGAHSGCIGIYPDWSNRSFMSLVTELLVVIPSQDQSGKLAVSQVREKLRQMLIAAGGPYVVEKADGEVSRQAIAEMTERIARTKRFLANDIQISRWKQQ
jgi:hypothetical protein